MKISVIIPAFNEEAGIADSLKAVLAQDHPDYEVIVVNNASDDKTADVASSFPDIKVVHEDRKGTMWACEAGRKSATGEIIVRMDADCLPDSDWLSRGAEHFKNEKTVIVSGPYDYHDASKAFRLASRFVQKFIYTPAHYLLRLFRRGGVSMGGNTFLRASALAEIGGFNTDLVFYGDDTDLPLRMSAVGKAVFDQKLSLKTSSRRYRKAGTLRLTLTYWYHFFKIVVFGKKKPLRSPTIEGQ